MTSPRRWTADDVARELARIREAPIAQFCFPCPRCRVERNPGGCYGHYTAAGLERHLVDVHGEPA